MKKLLDGALNKHDAKYFGSTQLFLSVITIVSIVSIILETVKSLDEYHLVFLVIEWFAVSIFTVEYLLRLYVSEKKLKYVFSFWGLIDVISIIPTFIGALNLTFLKSFRDLRILRMLRILRIGKISRAYIDSKDEAASRSEFNKINITIYFMTLASMTIIFASLLYALEHNEQAFSSIPLAMLQSAKIMIGGLALADTKTLAGEIIVIVGRFIGLALFGLLIAVIGSVLNQLLFGDSEK